MPEHAGIVIVDTRHTSSCMCVGCATRPTYVDLAPLGPLQAAFKSASGRLVTHPNHLPDAKEDCLL
ncbi:hypothetical protein ECA1899 [Pectobacterium atrosepticum SCRI1043]|uniref:Uncharacterized protein n=1 Tax=Pectobacterium atrosepticum (strain SCRI 1043 / ATCC BAA-672) TaxID=218491 RepID=Q6D5Y9_PECAS|nr:hypothetical protein ECA1899 [Pectobacterium atrosepticum SCRI1043]